MGFTLDTYWVQAGGGSPAAWLLKLKNRVDVIHIKDMCWKDGKFLMCEVMEGNLDWPAIIQAGNAAGVKYAMVEQDDCYGKDPFECLKTSFENWRKYA
jgi:sugar phosphate isomerase/epimerase